jgi:hypothetical protein
MRPLSHRAHGKIKWRCPQCGGHRMQAPSQVKRRARGRPPQGNEE